MFVPFILILQIEGKVFPLVQSVKLKTICRFRMYKTGNFGIKLSTCICIMGGLVDCTMGSREERQYYKTSKII